MKSCVCTLKNTPSNVQSHAIEQWLFTTWSFKDTLHRHLLAQGARRNSKCQMDSAMLFVTWGEKRTKQVFWKMFGRTRIRTTHWKTNNVPLNDAPIYDVVTKPDPFFFLKLQRVPHPFKKQTHDALCVIDLNMAQRTDLNTYRTLSWRVLHFRKRATREVDVHYRIVRFITLGQTSSQICHTQPTKRAGNKR